MPEVINTNMLSLVAQRNLSTSQSAMKTAMERLSSGLRINSAKDDAAGLAISQRFTAQINGLNQAVRNANDGISMAQTAEGALQQISNNLQRIRELAVQGSNSSLSTTDRTSIQTEMGQLSNEITRVSKTKYNGVDVIGTTGGKAFKFQVGANNSTTDQITVTISNIMSKAGLASTTGVSAVVSTIGSGGVSAGAMLSKFGSLISVVDNAIDSVDTLRGTLGAVQNRFESVVANAQNVSNNLSASKSRIMDADFAAETANLTRSQILQQAGTAMLAQANSSPQSVLTLLR